MMNTDEKRNIVFIDGSYFIFFRYYAMLSWYKISKQEIPKILINDETFVERFKRTFIKKIKEIPKKLGIHKKSKTTIYVAKDCSKKDIWRNRYIEKYKATRDYKDFQGQPFFKMAYDTLFLEAGVKEILKHPKLEADDCIAIALKNMRENKQTELVNTYIITGDHDYLQLCGDDVKICNLKFKTINNEKTSTGDPKCDLFLKIILGDKSDNISRVFSKCGKVMAMKLWNNKNLFAEKLIKENCKEKFILNKRIIDFDFIPKEYKIEFLNTFNIL